jgi:hypothetical protein
MSDRCETCRSLLSEGLDICVRGRNLDAQERTNNTLAISCDPEGWIDSGKFSNYVERHNLTNPDHPLSHRSGTLSLWIQEQYETDVAAWERRARQHLMQGCGA